MKLEEFWQRVDIGAEDACWPWLGAVCGAGYGHALLYGKTRMAHRIAYSLRHGHPPEDKPHVLHSCDVKTCVNPNHLRAGTHRENIQEAARKGLLGRKKAA